jgi:Bacteriophage head to tail connecting protein
MKKLNPKQLKARLNSMRVDRSTFESHWQEVADYINPDRNNITTTRHSGEKRNLQLLDNTGVQSNQLLAGALHGILTSVNLQWFELTTGNRALDSRPAVRQWLQGTSKKMLDTMNNSNFQTEIHPLYMDLTSFGTSAMGIFEDDESIIRFQTQHIKDFFIRENNKGLVDEFYLCWEWDSKQIIQEFGEEGMHKEVLKAYKTGEDKKFKVALAIYERTKSPKSYNKAFRYTAQYMLEDEEHELRESGFRTFPYTVPRWSKSAGEVYGRGPGMMALPDMKTLNKMTETMLRGAQKVVDPPLQAPDDGYVLPLVTKPGGINYYRSGRKDRIEPIFADTRIDFGYQALQDRRQRVRESFYVDQLQLNQGPQMTATEVLQRTEEKMRLLGPLLGRMQSEFLKPLIERVYDIMERRELLDVPPEELNGVSLNVQYSSLIARSQKTSEGQSIFRTMEAVAIFGQLDKRAYDNFKADEAVKVIADMFGFPQSILRTESELEEYRAQKAEQQQALADQQEAMMTAEAIGKVAPAIK